MLKHFIIVFTSFFYSGFFPFASGTFATLCFLPFYYFIFRGMPPALYISITAALYFLGVWASAYAAVIFKDKDPHKVVIDEVVGYLVVMLFIPFTMERMLVGFIIARAFDIIKPWPAYQSQKLKAGNGIMLDDVIASVYGNMAMWALIYLNII